MDEKKLPIKQILMIVGFLTVIAGIAFAVYYFCFSEKNCMLDDFDDDFDDDVFEDVVIDD